MNDLVELSRHTWMAVVKLAVVVSIVAVVAAVAASTIGNVPQAAIVLTVIVVAFSASWIQTSPDRRTPAPERLRTPATR